MSTRVREEQTAAVPEVIMGKENGGSEIKGHGEDDVFVFCCSCKNCETEKAATLSKGQEVENFFFLSEYKVTYFLAVF